MYTLMEEMYGLQSTAEGFPSTADYEDRALMTPENLILPLDYQSLMVSSEAFRDHHNRVPMFGSDDVVLYSGGTASAISSEAGCTRITTEIYQREEDVFGAIKARIASHPTYPRLIHAYIECQKVFFCLYNSWE